MLTSYQNQYHQLFCDPLLLVVQQANKLGIQIDIEYNNTAYYEKVCSGHRSKVKDPNYGTGAWGEGAWRGSEVGCSRGVLGESLSVILTHYIIWDDKPLTQILDTDTKAVQLSGIDGYLLHPNFNRAPTQIKTFILDGEFYNLPIKEWYDMKGNTPRTKFEYLILVDIGALTGFFLSNTVLFKSIEEEYGTLYSNYLSNNDATFRLTQTFIEHIINNNENCWSLALPDDDYKKQLKNAMWSYISVSNKRQ